MSYKIAFLNDEEFERLPMQNPSMKLGVAYPEYGEAYVRKTRSNLVDVFTLAHELEHLQGASHGEHYDSENKCYYKDAGQWMQTAAPFMNLIPGIGTVASIGMGAGGTALHQSAVNQQNKQAANQQNQMQNLQNSSMSQFQMPQGQGSPNVVQAGGGASGGSGTGGSVSSGGLAPQTSAQGAMQGNQFDPYHPFGQNGGGA